MRLSGLAFLLFLHSAMGEPVHLLCNHLMNPLGIDSEKPRLSWQNNDSVRDWHQSAYQILVASNEGSLRKGLGDVWDSGEIQSAQSVGIAYAGPAPEARKRYFWTVKVWDAKGKSSKFASGAWWEMGLLSASDWQTKWISRSNPEEAPDRAAMHWLGIAGKGIQDVAPGTSGVFRKHFQLASVPKAAALFVIARGNIVAVVNGHEVASKADWQDFDRKDVTKELVTGENRIELRVTSIARALFGAPEKFHPTVAAALLKMTSADGSLVRVGTDGSWSDSTVAGDLSDESLNVPGPLPQPAAVFEREFSATKKIASARLYATALGSYRVSLNGQPADANVLTPGFTDYRKRVEYQTYDVTSLIKAGENRMEVTLGDGWYSSPLAWQAIHLFAPLNRLAVQLELHYTDGSSSVVSTDSEWKTTTSPIVYSQIYAGEDYDARIEPGNWKPAMVSGAPTIKLDGYLTPAVHINSELKPETVKPSQGGTYVFDFGQNMVGWAQLKVHGPAGTRVRMRFAEILNPDGSIYRQNLRNADATDTYTLSGKGEEVYSPSFTFHGFRYVEVSGYPGTPTLDTLTGRVVGSLEEPFTGRLKTSNELVNRMWNIGLWGQRGNFVSIPTDCPQRDERLGWMGDAGVFWRTGAYNFDISAFTRKFMVDVVDAQNSKGDFSNVSPDLLNAEALPGAPGWSDTGVIVPYTAWLQYGDTSYIDDNWDAMQRFMRYIVTDNPDFIRKNGNGPNFADWLAPDPNSPKELVATAYWAISARMMSQMAHATGRTQDEQHYNELIGNIRSAYNKAFVTEGGEVAGGTQTAYLLTLYTDMAPASMESGMVEHLVKAVHAAGDHVSTGFLGTPFLLFTLSEHGRADIAYKLLLNETYPSWGYMLSKGATTWWERWNGDSGDPAMNSFNHYAFGSVIAWVYRCVAGIDTTPEGAGFQHVMIRPQVGEGISQAQGEYDSAYGKIATEWTKSEGVFKLKVQIPANASATVILPAQKGDGFTQDGKALTSPKAEIGSGSYRFEVRRGM